MLSPDVKYTLNDNSNAIFTTFKTIIPEAYQCNCYAHMRRKLKNYVTYLNNKLLINNISKELELIADFCFEEDVEKGLYLFHKKYADEMLFLNKFEKEYLNKHKGH